MAALFSPLSDALLPPAEPGRKLAGVAAAAEGCRRCPLYRDATQVVFGEAPAGGAMMAAVGAMCLPSRGLAAPAAHLKDE